MFHPNVLQTQYAFIVHITRSWLETFTERKEVYGVGLSSLRIRAGVVYGFFSPKAM